MKKALTVLMMLGMGATQAMAAEWRCVAVRGLGADEHTFVVDGLLIRGHEGIANNQAKAVSLASNECFNSGHARCKVVSCSTIEQKNDAAEVFEQE